jgi:crotonyl-CoA reductase
LDCAFVERVTSARQKDIESLRLPESFRAMVTLKEERSMFAGVPMENGTPSKALHLIDVPTCEPGHGEVLLASMASAVNYNKVCSIRTSGCGVTRPTTAG